MDRNRAIPAGELPSPPKKRIMIAGGSDPWLSTLRLFLEQSDFEVETASTVEGSFGKLGEARFDVLLLDPKMGKNNGEEVLYFLGISMLPPPKEIILLATTPVELDDSRLRGMVTRVLKKPFRFEDLLEILEAVR